MDNRGRPVAVIFFSHPLTNQQATNDRNENPLFEKDNLKGWMIGKMPEDHYLLEFPGPAPIVSIGVASQLEIHRAWECGAPFIRLDYGVAAGLLNPRLSN